MYRNLCCYCESPVGPVKADEIEHRMPVDPFPEKTFDWDNLHLACSGCNVIKSNQWDDTHPILDAVTDQPIGDHLGYKSSVTGVWRDVRTRRGRTTVEHCELNREKLKEARTQVFGGVLHLVEEINRRLRADPDDPIAASRRDELEELCLGPYGSMIRWTIESFVQV